MHVQTRVHKKRKRDESDDDWKSEQGCEKIKGQNNMDK